MKQIILLSLFTIIIFVAGCNVNNEHAGSEPYNTDNSSVENVNKNLVLVELFTSEG